MTVEYKYDVAFSFTQQDELLALQLYKLLRDRLKCFIYSESQKDLAGNDGELLFNAVFSKDARIVVILHRNQYGKTKWTRIEETAIRNRGFDYGYDFVILIPLDAPVVPPNWLPKNRLWIGLERWGIESAASVIEARVQEFGGTVEMESVADIAAKAERQLREQKDRELRINVENCKKELSNILLAIESHVIEIKAKASDWKIQARKNRNQLMDIMSYGHYLAFQFYQQYGNTLTSAYLRVALYKGYFDENGYATDPFQETSLIKFVNLDFDINELDQSGWSDQETGKNFTTTKKLVDFWIGELIMYATKKRLEQKY